MEYLIFFGAASLGNRPTIDEKLKLALEVFVFDFNKNIYSEFVEVYFLEKIRIKKNLITSKI